MSCVAYRKLTPRRCEMKRLYVQPAYRAAKLGERLAQAIMERARDAGFSEMVLDTLEPTKQAVACIKSWAFGKRKDTTSFPWMT